MLVTTVAVARTAGVEQYGIFALAMIAFQGGLLLRDAGLGQALIVDGQRRGMGWPAFLTISAVGIAVAVAMVVVTGLVAAFLALPTLGELARILALAFTIGSFGVTSNALLERSLRFKARAWIDIAAYTTLGIVTAVGLSSGARRLEPRLGLRGPRRRADLGRPCPGATVGGSRRRAQGVRPRGAVRGAALGCGRALSTWPRTSTTR